MDDPEFQSRQGHEILFFSKTSRPAVVTSQPYTHLVPQFMGARRPGSDADQSLSHRAEFKKEWSYSSIPLIRFHDLNRDNLTVICYRIYDSVSTAGRSSRYFALTFASGSAMRPIQLSVILWCPNSISYVKLSGGGEAYHAPASNARVKNQSCVFNPHYFFVSYNLIITLTNLRLSFYT
jgi:hypothetical protein